MRDVTNKAFEVWIAKQPIWHDSDLIKVAVIVAVVAGLIGFGTGYLAGLPDLSGMTHTGIRG